jgi:hypothetical protein
LTSGGNGAGLVPIPAVPSGGNGAGLVPILALPNGGNGAGLVPIPTVPSGGNGAGLVPIPTIASGGSGAGLVPIPATVFLTVTLVNITNNASKNARLKFFTAFLQTEIDYLGGKPMRLKSASQYG